MAPLVAGASKLTLLGVSEIVPETAGPCITVKVWPTPFNGVTVMVAVRMLLPEFATAVHCTEPGPIPEVADKMVSHPLSLEAVHCNEESSVFMENVPE
jgi:hypothetical protein